MHQLEQDKFEFQYLFARQKYEVGVVFSVPKHCIKRTIYTGRPYDLSVFVFNDYFQINVLRNRVSDHQKM